MSSIPTAFLIVEVVALLALAIAFISVFVLIRRNRRKPPGANDVQPK